MFNGSATALLICMIIIKIEINLNWTKKRKILFVHCNINFNKRYQNLNRLFRIAVYIKDLQV